EYGEESHANNNGIQRMHFGLEHAKHDMQHEQAVSSIDEHVEGLPNGCGQIRQPEIMAGRSHEQENHESEETERLKGHAGDGTGERAALENTENGIRVAAGVVSDDSKRGVNQPQQAHGHTRMPTIVKQRQEHSIQPAERPNAQDDVQKN